MSLKFTKNLAFRLTFLYAALFSLAFVIVFAVIYLRVEHALQKNMDADLLDDVGDMRVAYTREGTAGLRSYIDAEIQDDSPANLLIRVMKPGGELIYATNTAKWGDIPPPKTPEPPSERPRFQTFRIPKRPAMKARSVTFALDGMLVEQVEPMEWDAKLLTKLRRAFSAGAALTILLAISIGWLMARRALSRVKDIDDVARAIAGSTDLSQRVPLSGAGDELDRLATTFNLMLERLEVFVRELSDMMDNTAHDFKTPLARIRTIAETSLENEDIEAVQEAMVQIMDEGDRFLSLLNAIMDISEAKTGLLSLKKEDVAVQSLLEDIEGLFSGLAEGRKIRFHVSYPGTPTRVEVDKKRILQALLNILDNAFKVTPAGGTIALWAWEGENQANICVSDTGPGIPEEEIPRIFERFYRLDRSRSGPGRGIGLSLAKAFVEAHGGAITVESTVNEGSTFCIRLPLAPRTGAGETVHEVG